MKVLITGVAGFMGSHLADAFLAKGHQVVGIDNLIGGYAENVPSGVLVVHTACTAYEGLSVFSPALVVQNTMQITSTIMSAAVKAGVKKVVHLSSMARYGTQDIVPFTEELIPKPQDPYGIAKYAAELLIKNIAETHGLKYVILVPHNIIGPRQKFDDPFRNVASIMVNRMLQGKQPIIYGDGSQKRCFSFIQDVIDPLMLACESDVVDGMTVNIGPDEEFVTINELAKRIAKLMNFELEPIYMPGRPQEVKDANCSANLARNLLGYETSTSLDQGLAQLVGWIKSKGPRPFDYHLPLEFVTEKTPKTWTQKLI